HEKAVEINRVLALGCARRGWALGVGSQRRELEAGPGRSGAMVDSWQALRDEAPGLSIFANLGISQLASASVERIAGLVESLSAQALVIHLNPLQECLQPEGTPRFKGALEALDRLSRETDIPIIVKETGCGFSARTLARLAMLKIAALDV